MEKNFEEITVKELCVRAKTRTATFYTHFSDKYDFFSFMIKELRRSFVKDAELTYNKEDASAYYTALVCKGMDYLEHNEKLSNSIKGNGMLQGMLQFLIGGMNRVTEWWFANRKNLCKDAVSSDVGIVIREILD